MKNITISLLLLFSLNTFAENNNPFPNMQTNGMQTMMLNMQAIQSCMEKINQTDLMALAEQAKIVQENIQTECKAGNPKNAQKSALDFINVIKNSTAANQAQACVKELPDMMKGHIPGADINQLQSELDKKDICSIDIKAK